MSIVTVTLNPCIDKTLTVDRVVPDRKLQARDVRRDPGGGGLNVARVVQRLGGDVQALWSSGGPIGEILGRLLDAEEVPHAAVSIGADTRENLMVHESSSERRYRLGMPGPDLDADERETWVERLAEAARSARYVVFSGSLPGAGAASLDWYDRLLGCVPDDARLIVDTKKAALERALEHGPFLIKPNARELADITGRDSDGDDAIVDAARELVAHRGVRAVVVSLGGDGAVLVTADGVERFESPDVEARSKIGAGDSMVGGIVEALDEDLSLTDAVRRGVAAGAAAVRTEGTELCRREDVEELQEQVRAGSRSGGS